jgi:DNA-binding transcriptional MocR family regulator
VIADDLRELILGRGLAEGAALPSEADLTARYAVARVTANRAVRVLRDRPRAASTSVTRVGPAHRCRPGRLSPPAGGP